MKIYIFLFFAFISTSIVSQQTVIDSLKKLLRTNTINDTTRVKRLINLGGNYYYTNLDSSMVYVNKGLDLAKKINSLKWTGTGYCALAGVYSLSNEDSLAEINYKKAIDILKNVPVDKSLITAYGGLASVFSRQANYEESIRLRFRQLELAEKAALKDQQAIAYSALAITYKNLQNYDKCLLYMEKSIAIKEQLNDESSLCMGYINLGGAYHETGQYQKSIATYEKALTLKQAQNQEKLLIKIYQGLCNALIEIKEYNKALLFLDKVKVLCEAKHNESSLMDVYISYGVIYMSTKKESQGELFFLKARDLAKKIKNANYDLFINEMLYMLYSQTGNYKLAMENYKLFMEETMKQNDIKLKEQIDGLEIKYESEKKEEANKRLTETTKTQDAQIKQGRYITLAIIGLFIMIVFILILVIRQSKLVAAQKSMQLEQKLLRSQMNPHFIFNSLQAIQNYILKNEQKDAVRYLSSFATITRSVLENSRMELIPIKKEVALLDNYLQLQKLRFGNRFNYTIHVDEYVDIENTLIPPMLSQPFIENALEHGMKDMESGGLIDVYITTKDNALLLEIKDNGKGLSPGNIKEAGHQSLATSITKERIALMNKKKAEKIVFTITEAYPNEQWKGVKVSFNIPLQHLSA